MRELTQEETGECNGGFLCIALGAFAAFTAVKLVFSFASSIKSCIPTLAPACPPAPACAPAPTTPVQQHPVPEPLS